jgi:hypothetical protein
MDKPDVLEKLMATLNALLKDQLTRSENAQSGPKLQRLDKVLDMSKASAMSNTIAFSEGVDLESINKGKCVNDSCILRASYLTYYFKRASRVDVKKLEKQEAKLKAKIEKRAKRDLYEGSKLLEQKKKEVRLHSYILLADLKHLLVYSNPTKRCSCRCARIYPITSLVHGGADQSSAILCSLKKQKQGHSSPLYRRLLWLKSYPVRFSSQPHNRPI